jgi:hypothetical protein
MPIHRTSIEASVPMTTTNELSNGNVKTESSDMNLSIEYETPITDSMPMDEDEEEVDEEEVN